MHLACLEDHKGLGLAGSHRSGIAAVGGVQKGTADLGSDMEDEVEVVACPVLQLLQDMSDCLARLEERDEAGHDNSGHARHKITEPGPSGLGSRLLQSMGSTGMISNSEVGMLTGCQGGGGRIPYQVDS